MSEQTIGILVAVGMLVAGWMFSVWFRSSGYKTSIEQKALEDQREEQKQTSARNALEIEKIKATLAELGFQVKPMWERVQRQLSEDLHHPNPKYKEMDGLLEKMDANDLNITETERLKILAAARSKDMAPEITDSQRASATILATVMDKVLEEKAKTGEITDVELIGVKKSDSTEES